MKGLVWCTEGTAQAPKQYHDSSYALEVPHKQLQVCLSHKTQEIIWNCKWIPRQIYILQESCTDLAPDLLGDAAPSLDEISVQPQFLYDQVFLPVSVLPVLSRNRDRIKICLYTFFLVTPVIDFFLLLSFLNTLLYFSCHFLLSNVLCPCDILSICHCHKPQLSGFSCSR